jgi:hypothetical protein
MSGENEGGYGCNCKSRKQLPVWETLLNQIKWKDGTKCDGAPHNKSLG